MDEIGRSDNKTTVHSSRSDALQNIFTSQLFKQFSKIFHFNEKLKVWYAEYYMAPESLLDRTCFGA